MLTREQIEAKLKLLILPAIAKEVPMDVGTLRKIRRGDKVNESTLKRISDYLEERL